MASFFAALTSSANLDLQVNTEGKQHVDVSYMGKVERMPLFIGDDSVEGRIKVQLKGKKLEHLGIRVKFVGEIEPLIAGTPLETKYFVDKIIELAPAGVITKDREYTFEFPHVEKKYESYNGVNVRVRYFCSAMIRRQYITNIVEDQEIWVQSFSIVPEINNPIKMEVGIADALHIEFQYTKTKYHLRDVILGKIFFLLVRIPIRTMDISVIRKEQLGTGADVYQETETVGKVQVMDGAPVRGENIPVRIFLGGLPQPMGPTMRSVGGVFTVKYFLNLVLIDESDRKYFKQSEIIMWRGKDQV